MADRVAPAGNPPATDEIEVTSEMISAGVKEFCAYDSRFEGPADCVEEIYLAMIKKRRRK